jgi:type I restriction enzyme S subunit
MSRWPTVPLENLLKPADEPVSVQRDQKYPNFGIYSFGRGLFKKPPIDGMATSASALLRVRAGNFIYSRLFAFEGSYGLVDEAFDDHYVSNEYPSFEIDRNRLEPGFLKAYFQLPTVWQSIAKGSKGVGSRRIRVHPDQVLMHKMALPPLAEQQAIITRLDTLADKVRQVAENLDAIEADAERLLAVRFRETTANAPYLTMAEVAPLVRREVKIDLEGSYLELGIRSFGKGTFHKPPLDGAEVGSKRLFRIEAGDLLFSNVFAWEGAIAVAKPEDTGRFGSHRFISCVVNPDLSSADFLRYYYLTDDGMEKVGAASPGGAGRNRTLGLEKLMAIKVPVPSLAAQQTFDTLQAKVAELKAKHTAIRQANAALVPATLERVFQSGDSGHG